jgi:septal ring factor EnvC (AmiA/AmiB activator)
MSTLGKILTFFNVIAAIVLFVLAGKDYAAFRQARYAVFLHERYLYGLPVDDREIMISQPDDTIRSRLEPAEVLKAVYQSNDGDSSLGGEEVRTVMEELERVQKKIRGEFTTASSDDKKREILMRYLLLQATDSGERAALLEKIRKDIDGSFQDLMRRFDDVKQLHDSHGDPNWEIVRFRAARLLANLSFDEKWLERLRVVVGMEALGQALSDSADRLEVMVADVREAMTRDQGDFVVRYRDMLQRLKLDGENIYQEQKRLTALEAVTADRKLEVAQRESEVKLNREHLAAKTAETNKEVSKLDALQADLFNVQQRLNRALDAVRKLEAELEKRAKVTP